MRFPRVIDYMFENRAVRRITEACRSRWDTSAENSQLPDALVGIPTMNRRDAFYGSFLPQPASRRSSLTCSEICCETTARLPFRRKTDGRPFVFWIHQQTVCCDPFPSLLRGTPLLWRPCNEGHE